jgi:uncharacterized membrane protein YfcA
MQEVWGYVLLVLAGFVGGFLNTVVSSGSAVTLPALISFGLMPNIANATNRIPVFVGFLASTYQFHKKKLINWNKTLRLAIPLIFGTVVGVLFVEHLPGKYVNTIIIVALFVSFSLAIYKFKNLTVKKVSRPNQITIVTYLLFVLLGLWGGIIVLDTATFILFSLLLHLGIDYIESNAMKSALCLIFSFVSLCLFAFNGEVNWVLGGCLAAGSFLGGYVGSKFASKESSRVWAFALLIALLSGEILLLIYKSL